MLFNDEFYIIIFVVVLSHESIFKWNPKESIHFAFFYCNVGHLFTHLLTQHTSINTHPTHTSTANSQTNHHQKISHQDSLPSKVVM
jgi:hypothetical protein